ncbi:MAG: PAS domain-containing sensor histidine kinase [Victivallaceae bacterium]|nr:PAS domain-containing sensor histidine kinase [Victivallaceae bacterium]
MFFLIEGALFVFFSERFADSAGLSLPDRIQECIIMASRRYDFNMMCRNLIILAFNAAVGCFIGFHLLREKDSRHRIEQSEHLLRDAFNVIHEGVFEWMYPNGQIFFSSSFFKLCGDVGRPTGYITPTAFCDKIHPDDREYFQERLRDSVKSGRKLDCKVRLMQADSSVLTIRIQADISKEGPEAYRIIGTASDFSAETKARWSIEQIYNHVSSETGRTPICVFEASGRDLRIKRCLTGDQPVASLPEDEFIGRTLDELLMPAELAELREWLRSHDDGHDILQLDFMLERRNNFTIPARLLVRPTGGNNDEGDAKLLVTLRDLTPEYNANVSAMLLKQVADSLITALVVCRPDGSIHYFNKITRRIMPEIGRERRLWEFLPGMSSDIYGKIFSDAKSGKVYRSSGMIGGRDYEIKTFFINVSPGFACTLLTDMTEFKANEKKISDALSAERQANRKRLAVLSSINYELRKPLTGIMGFADLLRDDGIDAADRNEYLNLIIESGNNLLELWSSVLELTGCECGQVEAVREKMNINSMLTNLDNNYRLKVPDEVNLRLNKTLRDIDANIFSDESILLRIFEKLLDNAIRSSRSGWIEFGYTISDQSVDFYVSDNGRGLSAEQQAKLFEPFQVEDLALQGSQNSAGLDMAIAQQLVRLLGGKLLVESALGEKTTFTFSIPVKPFTGEVS